MGATMLLQQKMTPASDPMQQKMLYIMPIMFSYISFNLAERACSVLAFEQCIRYRASMVFSKTAKKSNYRGDKMLSLEKEKKICALVEELTGLMNLNLKAELFESSGQIEINITGADRAYLITDNGETLLSLQYILGRMIRQHFPELEDVHILSIVMVTCIVTKIN